MDGNHNDDSIEKIILLSQNKHIQNFYNSNNNFFRFGASQKSMHMVDRILNSAKIPIETRKTQLKQLVFQVLNETFLNDIEVAVWALVLENSVWGNEKYELSLSLIASAVFSKEIMGEDIEYLLIRFSEKFLDFRSVYHSWKNQQKPRSPSTRTINSMYRILISNNFRLVNYNYYLDEVIYQYLPYNNPNKLKRQETNTQEASIILPEFLNSLEPLPLIVGNSGSVSNYINLEF